MARSGTAGHIGEPASVRYRVDHPEIAELDSFPALWGPTLLFGLLAIVFVGLSISLWLGFIPE